MTRKGWPVWLASCALAALLALGGAPARAEEQPIAVPLSYITNLSNFGATTATGSAEIWRQEAEVKLSVQGMTVLPAQESYAAWLVDMQHGSFELVGRFHVSQTGAALLDESLPGSIADTYSLLLVTVQPQPDPHANVPSTRFSIAGFFPGNSAIQQQVHNLPDTGQYAPHPPFETVITPDAPATPSAPAGSPPWLPYAPLAVGLLCTLFVTRRTLSKGRR
jgi:hypothetical protein